MRDSRTIEWTLRRATALAERAVGQTPIPKLPRVARLMALAIRIDALIRNGIVRDYADVARLAATHGSGRSERHNAQTPE